MIMLQQRIGESPAAGDDTSESMLPKSSPVQQQQQQEQEEELGEQRQREIITINNEEYEEMSVHTDDEASEWEHPNQRAHEPETKQPHKHEHHPHHQHHPREKHGHQQQQQQQQQERYFQLQQAESIEELLGSSIESIDGDVDDDDDDHRAPPPAWSKAANSRNQAEALLLRLEDSPRTRIRKMIEADDLVSEDEEDDIDSVDGSMYEEYESPPSSDDYDDITDEEDDDDDAWSGEYVYEEIELPDHITPIQKNWMNSWFCSTHRRRMEQISEGEEESDSESEGSISLKDGKSSKGNDFDKSWGSLDSHMRSWHSQRSHRSHSPHYQVVATPPLLRDIKALLPAKSPLRTSLPKARKADQPPKQAETLVRTKEAVEEQELNDSLRLGDRTAFLKAKRKAAALKKERQKKKDKGKEKGKKSNTKDSTSQGPKEKRSRKTKSSSLDPTDAAPESTSSALSPLPPPPPPDQPEASTRSDMDTSDNLNNETNNAVNDSKSKSKRKSITVKLDSSHHEGSKSARTMEGAEVENSTRSKSKRNSTSKSKSSKSNSSSTDKEVEKSDRSISKSARRLKMATDDTQPVDVDSNSNRRRKVKDSSDSNPLASPVKTKKRSKTKQTVSGDAETELDGSGSTQNTELAVLPKASTGQEDENTTGSARQDPVGEKGSDVLFSDQEDSTNDDSNSKDADSFHKPDSKRSKRGKGSLSRLQSLPNMLSSIPDDDCETSSKASTVKTTDKKRPKSPKLRKSEIMQLPSQLLAVPSSTPLDTADPSKPSSEQSLQSLTIPSNDSVHQDTEEPATPTTSKSPRTKGKSKIKAPSLSSLDMDNTKKPSSKKISGSGKSSSPTQDDENSIKSRSASARGSKSRKKSDDKSHSKHKTTGSPDGESPKSSKPSSSAKRGGKRPGNLEDQGRSDPNLASTTNSDLAASDRPSLSPRKAKSMIDLNHFKPMSESPITSMANSSWSKLEIPKEKSFLQLDITDDGKADAKRLSTTRPVRPSLLSQMSWNEKMSQGDDPMAPMSLRDLNATGTDSTQGGQEGGRPALEEPDTPSTSNRKAGFFRFLISPLKRAKSFSVDRSKKTLKDQPSRPSSLLSPIQGSSRSLVAKEKDKKSHSLHQVSTVTISDGTPSRQSPDAKTLDLTITSNANTPSNDTLPDASPAATGQGLNGICGDFIKQIEGHGNSEPVKPALLFLQKDDSAGTIKTSMMSLSLDEETGPEATNVDPEADEVPTPENGEVAPNPYAAVSGKIQVKPNSFRISTNNWKSVFSEDQEAASRRTSS